MKNLLKTCLVAIAFVLAGNCAHATMIDWNTWTTSTTGTLVSSFTANGSVDNLVSLYPSYTPITTFADGTIVNNAPTAANGIIQLVGGNTNFNTVTFFAPVVNPVMAIWSLGQGGVPGSFVFFDVNPTLVSGGPSTEYNGQSITVSGNTVTGIEGNGTVEFKGEYTSISWTNPNAEDWYGFNVGAPVPEPGTMMLLGVGMLGLAVFGKRRMNKDV